MITDRVSTCGFLVIVSHLYPDYTFPIVMLIVLDIASHWFHVLRYLRFAFFIVCIDHSSKTTPSSFTETNEPSELWQAD